jgi:hypothetical protein
MSANYSDTATNSLSSSPSPTPSRAPFIPLLNPCPTLSPENPNIILVQRDYLYGSGMFIMFIFFLNICYTNWLHGKYTAMKKRPNVMTHNPSNIA